MQLLCRCRSTSRKFLLWIHITFIITFSESTGSKYYCSDGVTTSINTTNNTTGTIYTLLKGETFYGNNRFCQWVIDAGFANKRIHLTVTDTNLQWAPESAICTGGYDYVHIRDGMESSASTIVLWCGSRNPQSVTSTGRYLTITFQSDSHNPYKYTGACIKYQVFDSDSCAPEWRSPTTSDPYCYNIKTQNEIWNNAQMFCNYNQANLVVISSEDQQNYVKDLGQKSLRAGATAWIGLSKIASESTLRWINGSETTVQYFATQDYKIDEDCVLIDFDSGEWQTQHCSRLSAFFVCQTNKRGKTPIYAVPEEKKEVESQSNVAIILAGVLGSLVVVAGIITAVIVYLKCFAKKSNRNRHKQSYRSCDNNQAEQTSSNHSPRSVRSPTSPRPQPSAPTDIEADEFMYIEPGRRHLAGISPPTYDEATRHKGPVDVP